MGRGIVTFFPDHETTPSQTVGESKGRVWAQKREVKKKNSASAILWNLPPRPHGVNFPESSPRPRPLITPALFSRPLHTPLTGRRGRTARPLQPDPSPGEGGAEGAGVRVFGRGKSDVKLARPRGVSALPGGSAGEVGVEGDLDAAQGLGDGAAFLGLAGVLLERGVVEARHRGLVFELDAGDLETFAHLLQVYLGGGGDAR